MNPLQMLSARTATAAHRLSTLKARNEGGADARVAASAIRQLENAVEELNVATRQMHEFSDGLAQARVEARSLERRYRELLNVVPMACVFTNGAGTIVEANEAAADLFHISLQFFRGKPLYLFIDDRTRFLNLLSESVASTIAVTVEFGVRPRERKTRQMRATMRRLEHHGCVGWFFQDSEPAARD